jgi:hypothetical protein
MEFVCIKVKVLELIFEEQHIIINLLQIKDLLLLNAIMGFVCVKVKVLELISKEQHIILALLQIKDRLLLKTIMVVVPVKVKVLELIFKEQHIILKQETRARKNGSRAWMLSLCGRDGVCLSIRPAACSGVKKLSSQAITPHSSGGGSGAGGSDAGGSDAGRTGAGGSRPGGSVADRGGTKGIVAWVADLPAGDRLPSAWRLPDEISRGTETGENTGIDGYQGWGCRGTRLRSLVSAGVVQHPAEEPQSGIEVSNRGQFGLAIPFHSHRRAIKVSTYELLGHHGEQMILHDTVNV